MIKRKLDSEAQMGGAARILLQIQMKRKNVGYRELAELISRRWHQEENEKNIGNKIARGTFSAGFFLMCMLALDCASINLSADELLLFEPEKLDGDRDT